MSSSSEGINPTELQREEEQHQQEAANKIQVAKEKPNKMQKKRKSRKDWKHWQQKSPNYWEKRSNEEVDEEGEEKEDTLGVLVEVIMGLSAQYKEEDIRLGHQVQEVVVGRRGNIGVKGE
ncbi:hypothetical protein BDN67DRAFT_1015547 [Paxillus ammoniavirescens]|nr:hypothetical protein BDN67DRAFT_1015547 [Paxillus ammoniavirescens]